jgi:hypothetical protein
MQRAAEELVRLKVDVMVAPSSIYTGAAKRATSTIPIVFFSHADPFRQRLRELGYIEGRTLVIEYRWAEGKPDKMRAMAASVASGKTVGLSHRKPIR